MKTKEELNALKEKAENLNKKLTELNEDELEQVLGGRANRERRNYRCLKCDKTFSWDFPPFPRFCPSCGTPCGPDIIEC